MTQRFALYCAPDEESDLHRRATTWLGFDKAEASPVVEHLGETGLEVMASARRYGFHATLKAPMRLANGRDTESFLEAVAAYAQTTAPVDIGQLVVKNLDGFLALVPVSQSAELGLFAGSCVAHFEPFRATLTEAEIAKRIQAGLTARQHELLEQYGYPYVMDAFRMHLTLTDRLDRTIRAQLHQLAGEWFADCLVQNHKLDCLSVFVEDAPNSGFHRLADFTLAGTNSIKIS